MKRRSLLAGLGALLALPGLPKAAAVAEVQVLDPVTIRRSAGPFYFFPNKPIIISKVLVFDDRELKPAMTLDFETGTLDLCTPDDETEVPERV